MTVIEYGPDLPLKTAREARIWSEAQAEMRERCAATVEAEPEYPTEWPPDRLERLAAAYEKHGPAFVQTAAQVTVRLTKESIAKAIRALR